MSKDVERFYKQIQGKFENILRGIPLENGSMVLSSLSGLSENLAESVFSNSDISKHIQDLDLLLFIYKEAKEIIDLSQIGDSKTIGDFSSEELIKKSAEKFIGFLQGLPYEHDFYFQLPFLLPDQVQEVEITKNIKLIKMMGFPEWNFDHDNDSPKTIADLFSFPPVKDETFLVIKTWGYANFDWDMSASKQAYRTLKQFIYLGTITDILERISWKEEAVLLKTFFVRYGLEEGNVNLELPTLTTKFLKQIHLSQSAFQPISLGLMGFLANQSLSSALLGGDSFDSNSPKNIILSKLRKMQKFFNSHEGDKKQIERAIDWGCEGYINDNKINGFLQTCIGLEAILGDKNLGRNSHERLADRCSYLLGSDRKEREDIYAKFKKIYEVRSELIHGSTDEITSSQKHVIDDADSLLKRAILREIS